MEETLLNITPTFGELARPERIKCIIADCSSTFQNNSTLQFHLKQHHKLNVTRAIDQKAKVRYFCPETSCKYNLNGGARKHALAFFASRKYLRQHFLKVHAVREYNCDKCAKKFASQSLLHHHTKMCGILFRCGICGWTYSSREGLLTHCRRKGHAFPATLKLTSTVGARPMEQRTPVKRYDTQSPTLMKWRKIAPDLKAATAQADPELRELLKCFKRTEQSIDTDAMVSGAMKRRKMSQMTQTASLYNENCNGALGRIRNDAATSTASSTDQQSRSNDSITEQTVPSLQSSKPSDKYKNLDLIDEESSTIISNASQTYRNLNHLNYLEDESTLNYFDNALSAGLCSIETQTPFPHSHMHTQTCDEILSDLGFADIETQTNWSRDDYNDMLVSTQTQTCFPQQIMDDNNISTQTETATTDNQCTQGQQTEFWKGA